jgi:L-alanine-DL-glutamate epimerase-like enolase superfamily enzyme
MPRISKIATAVVQANFHWTYVRVYSDGQGGLHGTGECFFAPGLTAVIGDLSEILVGEEALNIERLVEKMRWAASAAGSLGGVVKIADMAATANKPLALHMIGSPLALMASCHLALAIPNFSVCEFHAHDVPFFHELVVGGTAEWFRPGWVRPTLRPGFGVELDEAVGRRRRLPGSRWFDDTPLSAGLS